MQEPSSNGGTAVTSYHLQVKFAQYDSEWLDLIGHNESNLLLPYELSIPKLG